VITVPRRASNDDDDDDSLVQPLAPRRKWYGWQTLTADGASFGLLLVAGLAATPASEGGGDASDALVLGSVLGYEFAPGILHFVHKNPGRAFASMGLRLGMPLAGAFVGASLASRCSSYDCQSGGAAVGALLGVGGAIAIDAAVFAFDDPERANPHGVSLSPLLVVSHNKAVVGIGGEL
jgi:hypothetical protein